VEPIIRPGTLDDVDAVLALIDAARSFMRAQGNAKQWANGYPSRVNVLDDIAHDALMICEDASSGEIAGAFCMQTWPEHTYRRIFEGTWPDEMPYGTIHRIVSASPGQGIGSFCLRWAQERFGCLRADTHADNAPMQAALQRAGFVRCGIVYMDDGSPRIAFFWKREPTAPRTA